MPLSYHRPTLQAGSSSGRDTYYEVSTFRRQPNADERSDRDDDDGVLIWNDNEYGTIEDAQRRDFTVNALYLDVIGNRGIIDFTDGLKDIDQRIVRTMARRRRDSPKTRFACSAASSSSACTNDPGRRRKPPSAA